MATATKKCKVCGGDYEYCHTVRRVAGVFRWQDVACCPEHGVIYLEKIRKSREIEKSDVTYVTNFDDLDECDGEDDWFELDFDEEDDF